MIQRISAAHLQQLSKEQEVKLRNQWIPQEGEYIFFSGQEEMIYYLGGVQKDRSLPLLTIGQMLAYIHKYEHSVCIDRQSNEWKITTSKHEVKAPELCDALWEATKSHL
ncbi:MULTISPECIES: hypothetical protein [unclassified Paenibacillus]|uniref:hypothetical protein n=1 Tax=unclassified Paenibacillus TaxID=185978 RepID=UPI001AE2C584|nr:MULTISPECIES: hypothetical protein [unclassified Paenibacillus]MBP1153731.1 hypothetical protein [Paenibacillus sp. PvP091]MBP1170884.1 hypothetical protein [Paenibacillus sp. PvR098]MBP2441912.1 hypothetical protein [Paenibacillus sp. PvP052]